MWYDTLLEYLGEKICPSNKEKARLLVSQLLKLLKEDPDFGENFEPEFIFGVMVALYDYSTNHGNQNVSLDEFGKYCIGLIMVFSKISEDLSVYCSDFIYILSDKTIVQELKIKEELANIRKDYLEKKRVNPDVTPFIDQKDVENPFKIYSRIGELAKIDLLKQFESHTLACLNFSVKIQTEKIVGMLNDLLNHMKNQQVIVSELYQYLLPYKGKDDLFDALILSLKRELKKLTKTQLPSTSKINLVLIPALKLDHLPRYNPEIVNICEKLENYVFKGSNKKGSFFSAKNYCNHTKEVNEIVQKILKGNLLTIEAILHELAKINIENRKDELILLIKELQNERACIRKL
ncbi:TPA: hypothetical protein RG395_001191 [Legionella pneumophila]|uniref:hypothetical protein n=1 Tax=Legionella pneumophila TaxID=446 RepID=UPI000786ADA0|nr:hypothetical protein [Legionella pneumophila]HAT1658416.1 hypothetical protein [Legionella pneumophila]HAT1660785.1 hypothetical protein [Legionella pneumophila]HAT1844870.1 hypothetical protein [Legionella pneumophila]HAT1847507.1 hypothetical protein [Legionella pneumophila]HAT1860263.1 hypothetical protein [Legionella pneumophila]